MKTNLYSELLAKLLSNDSIVTSYDISLGDDKTTTANVTNTTMDNELGTVDATFSYNNNTHRWTSQVNGFDATFDGETIREIGVKNDTLIGRTTAFTPFTVSSGELYFIEDYSELNQSANTTRTIVTDTGITNLHQGIEGISTDYPTHIAFSTHLILDTFNVTTGWTPTGGTVALSTNKQEGTGSVALTKSSGSTTVSMTKTLGATVDMSQATILRLWNRINTTTTFDTFTTTNCLTIRIGNDSSNYKQIQLDKSDLFTFWNLLQLDISTFTTTGTVDMSTIDYLYIAIETNNSTDTWSGEEVLFDFMSGVWDITDSDTTLHEEVVRTAITIVERENTNVTYRGTLGTGDGNTYNYFYAALFDAASNGDMFVVNELYLTTKDVNRQLNSYFEIAVRIIS